MMRPSFIGGARGCNIHAAVPHSFGIEAKLEHSACQSSIPKRAFTSDTRVRHAFVTVRPFSPPGVTFDRTLISQGRHRVVVLTPEFRNCTTGGSARHPERHSSERPGAWVSAVGTNSAFENWSGSPNTCHNSMFPVSAQARDCHGSHSAPPLTRRLPTSSRLNYRFNSDGTFRSSSGFRRHTKAAIMRLSMQCGAGTTSALDTRSSLAESLAALHLSERLTPIGHRSSSQLVAPSLRHNTMRPQQPQRAADAIRVAAIGLRKKSDQSPPTLPRLAQDESKIADDQPEPRGAGSK